MGNASFPTRAERFFRRTTARPWITLALAAAVVAGSASFLPQLTRNTSADAFITFDHPSLVQHSRLERIFGRADPMVIAVVGTGSHGVFTPEALALVAWLTERVGSLPGIDPERVTSLTTATDAFGDNEEIRLEPLVPRLPANQEEAAVVGRAVMRSELHLGRLIARDGSATLIVAALNGERDGAGVYADILDLARQAPTHGAEVHVAGEAAVTSYLGHYIDSDARRLYPLAFVVIAAVLFVGYGTLRAVLLPIVVVAGAVVVALGSMAAMRVPFYVITNALPVIIVTIGVADSIHIFGRYYEGIEAQPRATPREVVVRTMADMWRPVTLTSVTDMAGFLALGAASSMPPVRAFGVYAAVGSGAALLFSLFVLPACLTLLEPRPSRPPFGRTAAPADRRGSGLARVGVFVTRRPSLILMVMLLIVAVGVAGALRVEVNEERIENFNRSDPIYLAHRTIAGHLDGASHLDILIETNGPDGLLRPEHLRRIQELQRFLETLPGVSSTISLVDFLQRIDRAMNQREHGPGALPEDEHTAAQYLLLYSASGRAAAIDGLVDADSRTGIVRATLNSGLYSDQKRVVEATERYLRDRFNTGDIAGAAAGRVELDYRWMEPLKRSALLGLALALLSGWLTIGLATRSAAAATLAVVPVATAVLLAYAAMGFGGIWLGVGTSMFAAIAIGTAINPAVHIIDRLAVLTRAGRLPIEQAFSHLFATTGRALLFDLAAVLLGFGVLLFSDVPPLVRFGVLVTACVITSFVAAVLWLPALVCLLRPGFLTWSDAPVDHAVAAHRTRAGS